MFALALWDRQSRSLALVRDRVGEKPLYYGWAGSTLVFGSEIKALKCHPDFNPTVSKEALGLYLRHVYVPAPFSIWEGLYKLQPGTILRIDGDAPAAPPVAPLEAGGRYGSMRLDAYWSLKTTVEEAAVDPVRDERDAAARLEMLLEGAVRRQMIADVPLGAFLSGGVDSSTVVSLMQKNSPVPVRTFTIGFDEAGFDESVHADAVARHLGTDHTQIRVTDAEARSVIPLLPELYDEPFADSSQIPTFLVSRAARSDVKVALSGDGGDELFGGYERYLWWPAIMNMAGAVPLPARRALGALIGAVPAGAWNAIGRGYHGVAGRYGPSTRWAGKASRLASRLQSIRDVEDIHLDLVTEWRHPDRLLQSAMKTGTSRSLFDFDLPVHAMESIAARMMYRDTLTYLPDDILCKVDRASMGVSIEVRVPFLDHEVLKFAWSLPIEQKIRGREGKRILRQLLYRYVPQTLVERPKAGFAIPIGQWLRGPLRDWAEALIDERRLDREGFFEAKPIRKIWAEHLSDRYDWTAKLWTILMFQAWHEAQ